MKKIRLLSLVFASTIIIAAFAGCDGKKMIGNLAESGTNPPSTSAMDNTEIEKESSAVSSIEADTSKETDTPIKSDTSKDGYITSKDTFVNKMAELLDISLYSDLSESDNTSFINYFYQLKYENKKDYDLDYKIKLGDGSEFTLPITFSDLERKGWVLQGSSTADREIGSGLMTFANVENASGKMLRVSAYNPTKDTVKFKKCTVVNIEAEQFSELDPSKKLDTAIDFTVCGSLTNTSTLEDIVKRLGDPYSISCTLHYDKNGAYTYSDLKVTYRQKSSVNNEIVFELSGDGNYITSVKYNVAPK